MNPQWTPQRVVDRVLTRIDIDDNGCWVSRYADQGSGYAYVGFSHEGKMNYRLAHRVAWVHFNGPIPEGLVVNHLCKNRRCVNPEHLSLLTLADNTRDQINANAQKTHCPKGHVYDHFETGRRCRRCRNERERIRYHNKKGRT